MRKHFRIGKMPLDNCKQHRPNTLLRFPVLAIAVESNRLRIDRIVLRVVARGRYNLLGVR